MAGNNGFERIKLDCIDLDCRVNKYHTPFANLGFLHLFVFGVWDLYRTERWTRSVMQPIGMTV